MRAPIDALAHSWPFDPDAYLRVDDFAVTLADSAAWDIEVHEKVESSDVVYEWMRGWA